MANRQRGEICAQLGEQTYTLCLTLGALSELESAFATGSLAGIAARFESGALSARDLICIIGCGLRGAGNTISDVEAASLSVEGGLPGYVAIAADLLAATFGTLAGDKDHTANPSVPQDA